MDLSARTLIILAWVEIRSFVVRDINTSGQSNLGQSYYLVLKLMSRGRGKRSYKNREFVRAEYIIILFEWDNFLG